MGRAMKSADKDPSFKHDLFRFSLDCVKFGGRVRNRPISDWHTREPPGKQLDVAIQPKPRWLIEAWFIGERRGPAGSDRFTIATQCFNI